MQQMGADTQGKVSYEQFLQCRLSHRTEIEALRVHSVDTNLPISGGWINANDLSGNYLKVQYFLFKSGDYSFFL